MGHKLYEPAECVIQSMLGVLGSLSSASVMLHMLQSNCADENVSDTSESLLAHDTENQIKAFLIQTLSHICSAHAVLFNKFLIPGYNNTLLVPPFLQRMQISWLHATSKRTSKITVIANFSTGDTNTVFIEEKSN